MGRKISREVAGSEVAYPSEQAATFARARRRTQVAELYLRGSTQVMIAQEVGCSAQTVQNDLKKIMDEWMKESSIKMEERKAKELAKIDHIEAMAWRGWELSIERQEVHRSLKEQVRQQVRGGDKKVHGHKMVPVRVVEETIIKGQSGDPRFLEQAARCVEMRLRILGLWKVDPAATNQLVLDWTGLFKAQAERARQQSDEHERARLGYVKGVELPVKAGAVIDVESSPVTTVTSAGTQPTVPDERIMLREEPASSSGHHNLPPPLPSAVRAPPDPFEEDDPIELRIQGEGAGQV